MSSGYVFLLKVMENFLDIVNGVLDINRGVIADGQREEEASTM